MSKRPRQSQSLRESDLNDPVLVEAKERFTIVESWENTARSRYLNDLKFAEADPDNGFQWPSKMYQERTVADRPALTINQVRQHNLQIINELLQNKPTMKVRATGNGATQESAMVLQSLMHHIEYRSNASVSAYPAAMRPMVKGGIGYWRLVTAYMDEMGFDQEIIIKAIPDPLTVYPDPDAREPDKSDMKYCFLFEDLPQKVFERRYPNMKDTVGNSMFGRSSWVKIETVRVCEYYRVVETEETIYAYIIPPLTPAPGAGGDESQGLGSPAGLGAGGPGSMGGPDPGSQAEAMGPAMGQGMEQGPGMEPSALGRGAGPAGMGAAGNGMGGAGPMGQAGLEGAAAAGPEGAAGDLRIDKESDLRRWPEFLQAIKEDPDTMKRTTTISKVEWYFIIGDKIAEQRSWPGKTIPVVPVIGEEMIIDGQMDRRGHTRSLKDPQRMYNYWASSAVEFGALQTKTPWIGAVESIEGHEADWENANRQNKAILLHNAYDDQGQKLEPPKRVEPPVPAPISLTGMQMAQNDMMLASGQQPPSMGQQSNERTGAAIEARQGQGENATFHYLDNFRVAVARTAGIILEIFPKIYDTPRVLNIMAENKVPFEVQIDPKRGTAFAAKMAADQETVARVIFDPNVGTYEVQADVGPGYSTKREAAFEAYKLLLTQSPALTAIIGDLMLQAGDFPLSDEAAARLRRMVPPQALGEGPSETEKQLAQQLEQMKGVVEELLDENAKHQLKLKGQDQRRDIQAFQAITQRLKVILDSRQDAEKPVAREEIEPLLQQVIAESFAGHLGSVTNDNPGPGAKPVGGPEGAPEQPPMPGAQKGPDGQWYLRTPQGLHRLQEAPPHGPSPLGGGMNSGSVAGAAAGMGTL